MSRYEKPERCPECGGEFREQFLAEWGRILRECRSCTVRQWCDREGNATGTPANVYLRKFRMKAHDVFDRLWRSGKMTRKGAYKWLAQAMNRQFVHMAELSTLECDQVVKLASEECKRLGV